MHYSAAVAAAGESGRIQFNGGYYNSEKSQKVLEWVKATQGTEAFLRTLTLTEGYIGVGNWEINKNQFVAGMQDAGFTGDGFAGILYIGVDNVLAFANKIKDQVNATIFSVFQNLGNMVDHIESFYTSGLTATTDAKDAQKDADAIKSDLGDIIEPPQEPEEKQAAE